MLADLPVSVVAKGAILVAAAERPPIQIRNDLFYSKVACGGSEEGPPLTLYRVCGRGRPRHTDHTAHTTQSSSTPHLPGTTHSPARFLPRPSGYGLLKSA